MTDGSVPISTLIAIVTGIVSVAAGGYAVVLRFSFETYQKSVEKRFSDLEKASDEDEKELKQQVVRLMTQNHDLEKATIRLEGEVKLLSDSHGRSNMDLESIKENMVRKSEWDPRMERIENQIDAILKELRASGGRYAGGSTPRFSATEIAKK